MTRAPSITHAKVLAGVLFLLLAASMNRPVQASEPAALYVSSTIAGEAEAAASAAGAESVDEVRGPISFAQPVGSVTIAGPGDSLGRRRYSDKQSTNGVAVINFSARASFGSFKGGLPSGLPVAGARVSSNFGSRFHPILGQYKHHSGIDLAAPTGTPVRATSDGRVMKANWAGGYGLMVSIEHGDQVETRYAHMSRLHVTPGQVVKKGEIIGLVGSTGRSTGPHLHYEIRKSSRAVNPVN